MTATAHIGSNFNLFASNIPIGINATTGFIRTPASPNNDITNINIGITINTLFPNLSINSDIKPSTAFVSIIILKYPPNKNRKNIIA